MIYIKKIIISEVFVMNNLKIRENIRYVNTMNNTYIYMQS